MNNLKHQGLLIGLCVTISLCGVMIVYAHAFTSGQGRVNRSLEITQSFESN